MVSFRISSRATKLGPSDARKVAYTDGNLMDEVHMEQ